MATPTTTARWNVPIPGGAARTEEWQQDGPFTYRVFEGEERTIGDGIRVWTHGIQYQDGRIDDGARERCLEAPGISVDGVYWEKNLSSETARHIADLRVTAAGEVDRWAERHRG